jgi:DUF1009 family protein
MKKLAIFAASGEMTSIAIQKAIQDKLDFIIIGFDHISDFDKLNKYKDIPVYKKPIGHLNGIYKILKKENVGSILMVGKIKKVKLMKILKFDLPTLRMVVKLADWSDTSLLQGVVDFFSNKKIKFISQKDFYKDLIIPKGFITRRKCKKAALKHLQWAYQKARDISKFNIGQSLLAGKHVIISVEGVEGTDQMIKRSKDLLVKGSCFVKVARPGYNPAFDLPGFGLITIKNLNKVGVQIIALQGEVVLIPHIDKVIEFANKNNICIYGF